MKSWTKETAIKRRAVSFCNVGVRSTNWIFGGLLLLFLVCWLSSCTNPTGNKYVNYPVQFTWPTFTGPGTSVNSPGVVKTDSIISLLNSFIPQDVRDLYSGTPSTQSDSLYVWTGHDSSGDVVSWTALGVYDEGLFGGYIERWFWTFRVNGKIKYTMDISFGGLQGWFSSYTSDSLVADADVDWFRDSHDLWGVLYDWDTSRSISCTDNPDKSGRLELSLGDLTSFQSEWNADGSGEWWDYDTTANTYYHGTWK